MAFISGIVGALILKSNTDLFLQYGKLTIFLLVAQMTLGVAALITGVSRKLRTVQVLAQAAPLCQEWKDGQPIPLVQPVSYKSDQLKTMLKSKTAFVYPSEGLSDRLLHQYFPDVLLCSPVLQDKARKYFLRALSAVVTCSLFLLMLVSASLGLFTNQENASIKWAAVLYFYFLCAHSAIGGEKLSTKRLIAFVLGAIFFPILISWIGETKFPAIGNSIFICLTIVAVLPAIQLWSFFSLLRTRLGALQVETQTSTRSMRLKGTLVPEAIFSHFVSAFHKEAGSVTRCYEDKRLGRSLTSSPATDRGGSISGEMLHESEPILTNSASMPTDLWGWIGVALALAGLGVLYVVLNPSILSFNLFIAALAMITHGLELLRTAEFFSTECLFQSRLILLSLEGTFTTALAAAAGSGQSFKEKIPNIDVNVKVVSVDLLSAVFAKAGQALPFQNVVRHVLGFGQNERFTDTVVGGMTQEISKQNSLRQIVISFSGPLLPGAAQPSMLPPP